MTQQIYCHIQENVQLLSKIRKFIQLTYEMLRIASVKVAWSLRTDPWILKSFIF